MQRKLWDQHCGFRRSKSTTDQYKLHSSNSSEKWEYSEAVHQLFLDFKNACDSVRREVLYNILMEFGIPMLLVRLIKVCLNETYSRVRVGNHLSDMFPIRNGLRQGYVLTPLVFNFDSLEWFR